MAKTKQRNSSSAASSAAQRRDKVRQQRQAETQSTQTQQARRTPSRRRVAQRSIWQSPWTLVGIIVVLVAIVVGVFFFISNQSNQASQAVQSGTFKTITSIDPKTLATVGNGGSVVKNPMVPIKSGSGNGAGSLTGPTGKPEVLYVGAEYCPYCAAQRWAMIVTLSRFGKFTQQPTQIQSSEDNISTFSFHGSSYTSQYIDFVAAETTDNNNNTLDTLTSSQQALFDTYDSPPYVAASSKGGIPFIDINNQYVSSGSYYSPQVILNLSQQDIANQVTDTTTDVSKGILGSANYLTAAICKATNNQPASVCTADPIPSLQQSLPALSGSTGSQLAAFSGQFDIDSRRRA